MLESFWAPRRLIPRLSSAAPLYTDRCVRAPLRSCSTSGSHIEPAGWDWLLNNPVKRWCRSTEGEEKGRGRDLCVVDDSAQCSEDLCIFTFPGAVTPFQLLLHWLRGGGGLAVQDFPSCLWERGQVLIPVLLEKGREKYNTRTHYRQEKKKNTTQIDVPWDWHWGLFWLLKVTSRSWFSQYICSFTFPHWWSLHKSAVEAITPGNPFIIWSETHSSVFLFVLQMLIFVITLLSIRPSCAMEVAYKFWKSPCLWTFAFFPDGLPFTSQWSVVNQPLIVSPSW